jgi:two-component system, NarL family, nitrate/nitrite response regulator NarL
MSPKPSEARRLETVPDAPEPRVRVVIADEDGLARSMLRAALDASNDVATVATTGDGRNVLDLVGYYEPTMLILDTSLLSKRGTDLIHKVRLASPDTRVLTIAASDDQTALAALRAGSFGHLTKDIDPGQLARLVTRAAAGEAIVPRRLTAGLLELLSRLPTSGWRPVHSRLTTREWEIIELLADGASTQDIADRLVLSPTTVYSHVKSLLRKLGVHSRRDAVVAADRLRHEETLGQKSPQWEWRRSTSAVLPDGNAGQRETPAASRAAPRVGPSKWRGAICT